jgi:hypothetical protein
VLLIILILLLLLLAGLFPVQKVSFFIVPASLLAAMLLLHTWGDNGIGNISLLSISWSGASLAILFIIIRLGSLWICQIVTQPVTSSLPTINSRSRGAVTQCFLVVIQAHLFITLLGSELIWDHLMLPHVPFDYGSLMEQVKSVSLSTILLLLPIVFAGILLSFVLFIVSALPSAASFSSLLSLIYSTSLMFAFYLSLPLFVHAISGMLRG